jgi:hypothetical protein
MKAYGGVDVQTHVFLTSALVGGEWPASHSGRFTPGERAAGTHLIGGWVDPQSRSGHGEEKILDLTGTRTPDSLVFQPVASRYTDYAIPAQNNSQRFMEAEC